jgi:uncharacterized surface protein with fasciclin (FAS1) repeats
MIEPWLRALSTDLISNQSPILKEPNTSYLPILNMKALRNLFVVGALIVSASATNSFAQNVTVGGEVMYKSKDIIDNAVNSKEHTTLVAAVKAAGLVETLKGKGPFTVFAPVNDAFENLPAGTVESLLKPENKATLAKVLTYHVVAGKMDFTAISAAIKKGGGKATLTTVEGEKLTAMMNGMHNIQLKDAAGNVANISTYDVYQSNGVIHVIDRVWMPKM